MIINFTNGCKFGGVQGFLPNGDEVAVKKLFNTMAQKDTDDFLNEVVIVTAIKHRNLVSLKGCCLKRKQRILVYEYVENYDLAQVLFGKPVFAYQFGTLALRLKLYLSVI